MQTDAESEPLGLVLWLQQLWALLCLSVPTPPSGSEVGPCSLFECVCLRVAVPALCFCCCNYPCSCGLTVITASACPGGGCGACACVSM